MFLGAYALNIFHWGEILPLVIIPYLFFVSFKYRFSKQYIYSLVLLTLFCTSYSILSFNYGILNITGLLGRLFYPLILFMLGYIIIGNKLNYNKVLSFLMTMIISLSIFGILSVFKTINMYGGMDNAIVVQGGRLILDVWGTNVISATALNATLSLGLGLLPIVFLKKGENSRLINLIILSVFILCCYCTLQISSRTGLVIILVSILSFVFFIEKLSKKKIRNIVIFSVVTIVLSILYTLNFLKIKYFVENTYLYYRFTTVDIQNDSRTNAWGASIKGLFEHPLGDKATKIDVGYAHNLWLDVGNDAGILPFIFILLFTVSFFYSLSIFLRASHPVLIKTVILSMSISFTIVFMLEPVIQGLVLYFTIFCFLAGVIHKINFLNKS